MAPPGTKKGRSLQMPEQLEETSSRIQQQDRQTGTKPKAATNYTRARSSRIAKLPRKDYGETEQRAPKKPLEPDTPDRGVNIQKRRSSRPSDSQAQQKRSIKQAQVTKRAQVRKEAPARKGVPARKAAPARKEGQKGKQTQKGKEIQTGQQAKRGRASLHIGRQQSVGEPEDPLSAPGRPPQQVARRVHPLPATDRIADPAASQLSHTALRQLRRETANHPLPEGLQQYKPPLSDDDMSKSASKANDNAKKEKAPTVYSQTFIDELEERGILDQQFEDDTYELEQPPNYCDIRNAIEKERPTDEPSAADYKEFTELALAVSNETEQRELYAMLLGDRGKIRKPHMRQHDHRWNKHIPIIGEIEAEDCKQVPHPDLAEGLRGLEVPRWIRKHLRGYAVPRARLAFPNFVVELKRDKSMFIGHVQNRHCGATALQAFVEYFVQLHDKPKLAWNVARVGSIEFNGSVIIGNVHWVSSSDGSGQDREVRKYHMTRVMCHFTYGLGYEDFKVARKEARNFRDYFMEGREGFLKQCNKRPRPQDEGPESAGEESENSDDGSVDSDNQEAARPGEPQANTGPKRRSKNKRDENQAAFRGGGRATKKPRAGRRKRNDQPEADDEPTGLTQQTQAFDLT
jgi:hypothetical protein